ncbi:hypothetical protein H311_01951 [Anncaliia algerae PRA109]|nr:hypothetical protein H311_01951 [Anncaliia algerae PRA109]
MTDAFVMVEFEDKIKRIFAVVIPNKRAETILSIIYKIDIYGSIIWTYEHKSYSQLTSKRFLHSTVCHKYNFVEKETRTHTQAVESLITA